MHIWKQILWALAVAVVISPAAKADVLYDNLAAPVGDADPIGSFGPIFNSFSTGASSQPLSGLTLLLEAATPTDGASFTVELFANSGNTPGASLATLASVDDSSLTTTLSDYVVTLATTPVLAANTRYWIGLNGDASSIEWGWALTESGIGVAGEFYSNPLGTFSNDSTGEPYIMQVTDGAPAAVPEPASLAVFGAALAGLGMMRRRKRA